MDNHNVKALLLCRILYAVIKMEIFNKKKENVQMYLIRKLLTKAFEISVDFLIFPTLFKFFLRSFSTSFCVLI